MRFGRDALTMCAQLKWTFVVPQRLQSKWPPGEGEMARLIRSHDWEQTPLGVPEGWPERLRTAIEIMLESAFPTFIWWGTHRIQLYNDAAIAIHTFRHPAVFAKPARKCWAQFWNTLGMLAEQAIEEGKAALGEDLLLVTDQRHSTEGGSWFTVSATPIRAERGGVGGVFMTLIETTRRLRAETRVLASEVRAKKLFQQAPGIVLVFHGPDHILEFASDAAHRLIGERGLAGRSAREAGFDFAGPDFVMGCQWQRCCPRSAMKIGIR